MVVLGCGFFLVVTVVWCCVWCRDCEFGWWGFGGGLGYRLGGGWLGGGVSCRGFGGLHFVVGVCMGLKRGGRALGCSCCCLVAADLVGLMSVIGGSGAK